MRALKIRVIFINFLNEFSLDNQYYLRCVITYLSHSIEAATTTKEIKRKANLS